MTGRIPPKTRPPAAGRGSGQSRPATPGQFGSVESAKMRALRAAEQAHLKRMTAGTPEADSLAILENEKRQAMEAYDAGVQARGGTVLPRGGAGAPPVRKYTEAEVRQRAIQRNQDPNLAVQAAREKGLL